MFEDFIVEFTRYAPIAIQFTIRGFVIFLISLSFVYISGRMLEILKTNRAKNSLALFVSIISSYLSVITYDLEAISNPMEVYFRTVIYISISVIFYVLAGFDLYDRFNHYCDKKLDEKRKKK